MIIKDIIREFYRNLRPFKISGKSNAIKIGKPRHKHNFFINIKGNNNRVIIGERCRLDNLTITLNGDNNHIVFDENVKFRGPCTIIAEGNSKLNIGSETGVRGVTFILKDASISIGKRCMFSYNILLRNHDSHKVINTVTGNVTNLAKDIILHDHIWLAQNCTILKGVEIGKNSIVAFGAIVTKNCPPNSVIAGCPAKVVANNITWDY